LFVKQDSGLRVAKACVYFIHHQCITLVASVNLVNEQSRDLLSGLYCVTRRSSESTFYV